MLSRLINFIQGDKEYTVSYYSISYMSNLYRVGTYTFRANRNEIKKFGSYQNVGFYKNRELLVRHFKLNSDGFYSFKTITH